jgi:hypothetical protein
MKRFCLFFVMGFFLLTPIATTSAIGQTKADYCHVYLMDENEVVKAGEATTRIDIEAANKALLAGKTVNGLTILGRFTPVVEEERLTTKNYPIVGTKQIVIVSVFYTDESMFSSKTKVADSVLIGIAVSDKPHNSALEVSGSANVEVTYTEFTDTVRQKTRFLSKGRSYLVGAECRFNREFDEMEPKAKKQ